VIEGVLDGSGRFQGEKQVENVLSFLFHEIKSEKGKEIDAATTAAGLDVQGYLSARNEFKTLSPKIFLTMN
jgi:hypothetical protein